MFLLIDDTDLSAHNQYKILWKEILSFL